MLNPLIMSTVFKVCHSEQDIDGKELERQKYGRQNSEAPT